MQFSLNSLEIESVAFQYLSALLVNSLLLFSFCFVFTDAIKPGEHSFAEQSLQFQSSSSSTFAGF